MHTRLLYVMDPSCSVVAGVFCVLSPSRTAAATGKLLSLELVLGGLRRDSIGH
jgi:protein-disulfide isomerase-like protein with CxxC motif